MIPNSIVLAGAGFIFGAILLPLSRRKWAHPHISHQISLVQPGSAAKQSCHHEQEQSPFFALPGELRNEIYRLVLVRKGWNRRIKVNRQALSFH